MDTKCGSCRFVRIQLFLSVAPHVLIFLYYNHQSIYMKKYAMPDFRIVNIKPYVIVWKNGHQETVTAYKLNKLKKRYSWKRGL